MDYQRRDRCRPSRGSGPVSREDCLRCAGSGWRLGDECDACAGAGSRPALPDWPRPCRVDDLAATEHAGDALFWPLRRAGVTMSEALAMQLARSFAVRVPTPAALARFAGISLVDAEAVIRSYATSLRVTARQLLAAEPYRDDCRGERTRRRASALEREARRVELFLEGAAQDSL